MNTKITDAAVEAARRAIYFATSPEATEADYAKDLKEEQDDADEVNAWLRAALEAAQPHMQPLAVDFDIDDLRELFETHAKGRNLTPDTWGVSSYVDPYVDNDWSEWVAAWKALAAHTMVDLGGNEGYGTRYVPPEQVVHESAGQPEMCRSSTNAQGMQVGEVQGDALRQLTLKYQRHFDAAQFPDSFYADLLSALAARQPLEFERAVPTHRRESAVKLLLSLGFVWNNQRWEDRRQPLGQGHLREAIATVCEGWTLPADARKILEKAMWEYVPPAQAVDLGQFIALAKFGEEFAFSAEKQPHSRVVYSQASRLLALIDQRDAGAGVES